MEIVVDFWRRLEIKLACASGEEIYLCGGRIDVKGRVGIKIWFKDLFYRNFCKDW
nr:hypothetical protein [Candidatus Baldrarchaeota archaeon]